MSIDIREFDGKYESAILNLHQQIFGEADQKFSIGNTRRRVKNILRKGRSAIAIDGRRLVGFGLGATVGNMPIQYGKTQQKGLNTVLKWAKVPDQSDQLQDALAELRGHNVSVRTYSNQFIRSTDKVAKSDWYMESVAVLPECRGKGIGRLLTQKGVEYAQDENAAAVYAILHLAGQGIGSLYTHFGFSPFLKITPGYSDGSAAKYVGKKL